MRLIKTITAITIIYLLGLGYIFAQNSEAPAANTSFSTQSVTEQCTDSNICPIPKQHKHTNTTVVNDNDSTPPIDTSQDHDSGIHEKQK